MKKEQMYNSLKQKLDESYAWPVLYMFKFIVPQGKQDQVVSLFRKHELQSKESKTGKYVSFTAQMFMNSSQDVINVYKKASTIEGLIAL